MAGETVEEDLVCYTAPGKVFASRSELLEHYKSDWHRYNLKRKVAELPPLAFETFSAIQARAEQRMSSKHSRSKGHDHVKARNRKKHLIKSKAKSKVKVKVKESNAPAGQSIGAAVGNESQGGAEAGEDTGETEYVIDMEEAKKPVNPCQSIFDSPKPQVFSSVEENLEHMQKKFGYFLPDCEYIVDVEGLIKYCTQKVSRCARCRGFMIDYG